jgi:hypothetical protein
MQSLGGPLPKTKWRARFLLLALTALLMMGAGARQEEEGAIELTVTVGFDGYANQESWIPLHVTVTNNGTDDIHGELHVAEAGFGGGGAAVVRPLDLPRGTAKDVFLYTRIEGYASALEVTLVEDNSPVASARVNVLTVGEGDWLIGIVSDAPQALSALGDVTPGTENGRTVLARLAPDDLPPVASAWNALDVLAFGDTDTGQLSEAQRRALRSWVNDGGRLVVIGGPGYQRTFAGLEELLPLEPTGDASLPLDPLAGYVGRPFLSHFSTAAPVVAGNPVPGAHVAVSSQGTPLVVWQMHGAGQVTLLTADPGLEPLLSWDGTADLWQILLSANWHSPPWLSGIGSSMYGGWSDARIAAAGIPGVTLPSALSLALFSLAYVMLIGPVNYLVLRRLGRMELAWLTVPVLAVVFTGMAYVTGLQMRGTQAIIHRLAMVQTWPDSDDARVSGLVGVWSPRRTRYDIRLGEGFLARPMPTDFGSTDTVGEQVLEQRTDTEAILPGVRVDVGGVESFVVDGHVDAAAIPEVRGDFTLEEQETTLTLTGTVTNESARDLRSVAVLALGEVHYIGALAAGESQTVSLPLPARQAAGAVTPVTPYAYAYTAPSPYSSVPYVYDQGYYDLPSGLLGGVLCYDDSANNTLLRECNLLESIINAEGGSWLNQVYVVAWDEEPLMPITIASGASEPIDLTVYFMRMPFHLGEQVTRIPPALMTWTYVPGADAILTPSPQPYEYYLEQDASVAFRFEPLPDMGLPANLDTVIVGLQGLGGSERPPFTVSLWNWERGHYTVVNAVWGDLTIQNARPFISEAGAVQVLLTANGQVGTRIDALDVTLESRGAP